MLLQLHPSPFANQLLSTLHTWITKLKSSLRINLDHSFQYQALFDTPPFASPDLPPAASPAEPPVLSLSLSHSSTPTLTPAQVAHHILLKALPLALQPTLMVDVVVLCKAMLTYLIPR